MNVQNEPIHDVACAVKRETPPVWRWKLCEFEHQKIISFGNKFDCVEGVTAFCWRCDKVKMRGTCLEAQKSIQSKVVSIS